MLIGRVFFKNRRPGKAEQLGVREKLLDRLVVVSELGTVALVEDKHHSFGTQRLQPFLVFSLIAAVERKPQLLNRGNDDLVRIAIGKQPPDQCFRIGVLLDAAGLKFIELFTRLTVQILPVHHKQAFVDIRVALEQSGRLERGKRFPAAGRVPDVAVAPVLVNAIHDGPHGINLVGPHHQQLLLACHQYHITADHLAENTLGKKLLRKIV
ncbi:hypothetical protein SDC9_187509 [bioreactor metagenome]|uniref:Uncharacterized protein n=1 Tax=bioreactor metagenome TaxID=1076179 RepID=A0A645HUY4_9ZZZZ